MLQTLRRTAIRLFVARLLVACMVFTAAAAAADHHIFHEGSNQADRVHAHAINPDGHDGDGTAEHERHAHPFYFFTAVLPLHGWAAEYRHGVTPACPAAHYYTRIPAVPDHPPETPAS